MKISNISRKLIRKLGFDIIRHRSLESHTDFPADFDEATIETILAVKPFTMTSPERIFSLCKAVEYVTAENIPGDIVECGVWRGGSMMAVARTLIRLKDTSRHLYLFDTFEGMSPSTEKDVDVSGESASAFLEANRKENPNFAWACASLEDVREAIYSTGYDVSRIHFIKGRVEDTIPENIPDSISLLRLDTDWYESTRHEMIHLYPQLSTHGVIIIDDYGHWKGARQAVDEYIKENKIRLLLNRIDYTGRIGIKLMIQNKIGGVL